MTRGDRPAETPRLLERSERRGQPQRHPGAALGELKGILETAMEMILTGRAVAGEEAERIGPGNRLVEPGQALVTAHELAHELARLPQAALRSDRRSAIEQWSLDWQQATLNEYRHGIATVATGETEAGARRFAGGAGRHGKAG